MQTKWNVTKALLSGVLHQPLVDRPELVELICSAEADAEYTFSYCYEDAMSARGGRLELLIDMRFSTHHIRITSTRGQHP